MSELLTRLIIVSNAVKIKRLAGELFSNKHNVEVVSHVYSITQLSQNCIKNRKNVILLDIAEQPGLEPYLKSINEKYHVLMISLVDSVNTYSKSAYKSFIKRPNVDDERSCEIFKSELARLFYHYVEHTPQPTLKNMLNTVSENNTVIGIASSTGGTEALIRVLQNISVDCPPILVVQHMPTGFTKMYADRLDKICSVNVVEASNNDLLKRSTVFIAPAGQHMRLTKRGGKLCLECFVGERINGLAPAADVLFHSMAPLVGSKAIGVILTGMGADGAKGLYEMRSKGSYNIGQDEKSCVVYGMPKAAFDMGAIDVQLPLQDIANHLNRKIIGR